MLQSETPEIMSDANCLMDIITEQMMSDIVMRNPRKALLHFTTLGLISFCLIIASAAQATDQIAEKALASTVYLELTDRDDEILGFGSGFLVEPNQIATNFHAIEGAAKGTATQGGKPTKYTIEGISAVDEQKDLVILNVATVEVEPFLLGDSDAVTIGETVYVAGNPAGQGGTFSPGFISGLREIDAKKRIQMTAPISPGSSGGPVLNHKGEVIGVSYMTIEGGQNLNFAIPSNYLKELLGRSGPAKPFPQGEQSISAKTYFRVGNRWLVQGKYELAILAYTGAIRLKPDYAEAYLNRGTAQLSLEQYDVASADYDTAIHLKPDFADAYYDRGLLKVLLKRTSGARQDFQTALELAEQAGDEKLKATIEKSIREIFY